jgi:hypothetical protein
MQDEYMDEIWRVFPDVRAVVLIVLLVGGSYMPSMPMNPFLFLDLLYVIAMRFRSGKTRSSLKMSGSVCRGQDVQKAGWAAQGGCDGPPNRRSG